MKDKWAGPTPEEILQGMFQAGKSYKQVLGMLGFLNDEIKEGKIGTNISCWDNVRGFFEMAGRFYVRNEYTMVLSDAELGIHMGQCKSPVCQKLSKTYFEVLRPSQEVNSERIAEELIILAKDLLLGKPRHDLDGRKSMFYDSQTGDTLFEVKVVDIADKCTHDEREVLLCYIPYSGGILCDIKTGVSQAFNISRVTPEDEAFRHRARIIGIDPKLFQAIILANAPRTKLLK